MLMFVVQRRISVSVRKKKEIVLKTKNLLSGTRQWGFSRGTTKQNYTVIDSRWNSRMTYAMLCYIYHYFLQYLEIWTVNVCLYPKNSWRIQIIHKSWVTPFRFRCKYWNNLFKAKNYILDVDVVYTQQENVYAIYIVSYNGCNFNDEIRIDIHFVIRNRILRLERENYNIKWILINKNRKMEIKFTNLTHNTNCKHWQFVDYVST